jgi:hypothetical protein
VKKTAALSTANPDTCRDTRRSLLERHRQERTTAAALEQTSTPGSATNKSDEKGAPRPRVWDETAALRAYRPHAWEISTRQGLLGSPPGVTGGTTKTVYTRTRERRGGGPAASMTKATLTGAAETG